VCASIGTANQAIKELPKKQQKPKERKTI